MSHMTGPSWTSTPMTTTSTTTTTSAKHRKMPSSTLPHTSDLAAEDDWTRVKDPKEKKRIQNRVAQRTYRHRMKARLGELQARLDSHEKRSQSATSTHTSSPASMTALDTGDSAIPPLPCGLPRAFTATSAPLPPSHIMEESPSPMALANDKPLGQLPLMPPSIYDQPVDDSDPALFPQAPTHMMHSPPQSQSSPPQAHGLLSPPQPGSEQGGGKMSQDFMLDCLQFQTQLLNRLNGVSQDPAYPVGPYGTSDNVEAMLDNMTQAEQVNALAAFTSTNNDGMDFGFDPACEPWKPDPFVQCQGVSPTIAQVSQMPSSAPLGPVMMPTPPDLKPITSAPAELPMRTEDRFGGIMDSVSKAGFDSFDQMVSAYYSDSFSDASTMANEQRLSRNRRLPKVISDISNAATKWSSWEQRGYYEEILKTAESMVISEGSAARSSVMSKIGPLIEAQDGLNPANAAEVLLAMKNCVQEELPNSWALTMALAADNRMSWQKDRSNTALATILLVNFSGRLPNDQILRLIGICL